eukprot:sb/3471022/
MGPGHYGTRSLITRLFLIGYGIRETNRRSDSISAANGLMGYGIQEMIRRSDSVSAANGLMGYGIQEMIRRKPDENTRPPSPGQPDEDPLPPSPSTLTFTKGRNGGRQAQYGGYIYSSNGKNVKNLLNNEEREPVLVLQGQQKAASYTAKATGPEILSQQSHWCQGLHPIILIRNQYYGTRSLWDQVSDDLVP